MQDKIISTIKSTFAEDVYKGLTDYPKHLSSKYFYDERGDRLFQDIMQMPEYYLTNSEFDILSQHKKEIVEWFARGANDFNLIELGAGAYTPILSGVSGETGVGLVEVFEVD